MSGELLMLMINRKSSSEKAEKGALTPMSFLRALNRIGICWGLLPTQVVLMQDKEIRKTVVLRTESIWY